MPSRSLPSKKRGRGRGRGGSSTSDIRISQQQSQPLVENRQQQQQQQELYRSPKRQRRQQSLPAAPTLTLAPAPALPLLALLPPDVLRARALWRACFGDSDGFTADGGLRIELSQPHHYPVLASLSTQAQAAFAFPPHATPPTRLESLRKAFGAQPQQQQQRH